ncbi:YtlD [Bacillus sp. SG-1]|nr:YtlD [Bacillus sp. SG-1]
MSPQNNIEQQHKQFLQNLKKEKKMVRLYQLLIFISFFSLWEAASRAKWIDPLIFSSPYKIWNLLMQKMGDGSLITHITITLGETVAGFILGTLMGTMLAALLWWSPFLSKVLDPYLVILNAMPKVALGPILIVALGPGLTSIIAMGAIISVIITSVNEKVIPKRT